MRARPARAIIRVMNANVNEEDPMTSTSTFFIETACVAGITPLGTDVVVRRVRAPRAAARRVVPAGTGPDERFVEELLATFTDRWEW
jgi:hypothetical protein